MEEQPPPPANVQVQSIERTQKLVSALALLAVGAVLIFSEIICLIRLSCHSSADIDMPPTISHSFLPLMAVSLLLLVLAYEASEYVLIQFLPGTAKFIFVWSVLVIVASIVEFIFFYVMVEDGSRDDVWDSLSDLGKDYYDDDKGNLEADFRLNVGLACLFQAIVAVLLVLVGIFVCVLRSRAPLGHAPLREKPEQLSSTERPLLHEAPRRALPDPPERALPPRTEEHPLAPASEIELQPYPS